MKKYRIYCPLCPAFESIVHSKQRVFGDIDYHNRTVHNKKAMARYREIKG